MNEKKIKELVGIITEKESAKVYSQGKNQGKLYYRLLVKCENRPKVNTIFAFREIVEKESVWKDIEESNYLGKKYLFYCQQWMSMFRIVNWKELKSKDHE